MAEFSAKEAHQAGRLKVVLVVVACFFVFEFAGARYAASDVLQADALHLLMDVLALAMSLFAMRLAVRKPTPRYTFGLRRAEPVAAVLNALLVIFASIEIVRDAVHDLANPVPPRATIMLIVAIAALCVNGVSAWLLHGAIGHDHGHTGHDRPPHSHSHSHSHGHDDDAPHSHGGKGGHALNLRGAWLHLLGDTLGSVAALVAAIVIRTGGPTAVDPIASLVVVAILLAGAARLLRDALKVLLEAAPDHLSVEKVRATLLAQQGVTHVSHLHVWTLGAGHDAITAHVRCAMHDEALAPRVCKALKRTFDVEYVTVQVDGVDASDASSVPR